MLLLAAYSWCCGDGGAWVLCCGADGHVTVEASGSLCCSDGRTADHTGALQPPPPSRVSEPRCGTCTDIPLSAVADPHLATRGIKTKDAAATAFSPLSPFAACCVAAGAFTPGKQGGETLHADGTLRRLRTTVLRC